MCDEATGEFLLVRRFADFLEQSRGDLDHFVIDYAVLRDGFFQRDGCDLVRLEGGHAAKFPAVHHVDGTQAVTRGQDAIEGAGRTSALDVAKHYGPRFEPGAFFDLAGKNVGNTAQLGVSKLVFAHILHDRSARSSSELRALCDDDDRKVAAAFMT